MLSDFRFALRSLAKTPGFAAIAILSLALGLGASTAIFSVVNAVLLRSLPVPNPQELRAVQWTGRDARMKSFDGDSTDAGNRMTADAVSPSLFFALREHTAAFADVFAFARLNNIAARAQGDAFAARGLVVSDNFFSALGTRPLLGHFFAPRATASAASDADITFDAVITAECWETHFDRDPAIIGRSVTLNGGNFIVVAVLPSGFAGVRAGDLREFYVPMTASSPFLQAAMTRSDFWWVRLMARLKPAATDAQLKAALDVVFPREANALMKSPEMLVLPGRAGADLNRTSYRRPLLLLMGAVGLVLLVACANLAGLSLARGAARQHELAVRAALGAGRWRLIRQSLAESLVLALLGGGLGILVAIWAKDAMARLLASSLGSGLRYDLSLDLRVLGFGLAVAVLTAVLSGLLPAWRAGRTDPLDGLKARGALNAPRLRIGRVLVAAQIALSLLLLAGAGLFLRTLTNLRHIDAGFDSEKLLTFQLGAEAGGFNPARRTAFYEQVQAALATVPGVQGASFIMHPLLDNQSWSGSFTFPGRAPSAAELHTSRLLVGETFFATMGIPIRDGRGLSAADTDTAPKVIVVNETFARKYLPNENPLGQVVNFLRHDWRIVGVCRDVHHRNIKEPVSPVAYFSFRQFAIPRTSMVVRTSLPSTALAPAIRKAVAAINPAVPVSNFALQAELRDNNISQERLFATLCGALAGLALLLACIGLYGLMAFNVARRRSEIAIRMAIGAQPRDVARAIVREALLLAAIGIGLGLPAALAATRLLATQLYGVQPNDPLTLGAAVAALAAVALAAAWLPARRAMRVDPITALRAE